MFNDEYNDEYSNDEYNDEFESEEVSDKKNNNSNSNNKSSGSNKGLLVAAILIIVIVIGLYIVKNAISGGNSNTNTNTFSVSPTSMIIDVGETGKINATSGSFFSSNNSEVCTVDNFGTVTGVNKGTCTISVKYNNNTKNCVVTVNGDAEDVYSNISFSEKEYRVNIGDSIKVEVYNGEEIVEDSLLSWKSSEATIFTVSDGTVIGISKGEGTLTVTYGEIKITTKIIVEEGSSSADTISVDEKIVSIEVGKTFTISPLVNGKDGSNYQFIYSSSDDNVAEVNATGIVLGKTPGSTTITIGLKDKEEIATQMTVTVIDNSTDIPPVDDDPGDSGGDSGGSGGGGGETTATCQLFQISNSNSGGSISSTKGGNNKTFTTGSQLKMWINGGKNCGVATKVSYCTSTTGDSCTLGNDYTAGSDYVDPIKINLTGRGILFIKIKVTYKDNNTQTKKYWMKYYLS